jgi:hypothetical protein
VRCCLSAEGISVVERERGVTIRVANAHREGGETVSDAERAAIDEISATLGDAGR